jgi:phytoene/squalene synthetase
MFARLAASSRNTGCRCSRCATCCRPSAGCRHHPLRQTYALLLDYCRRSANPVGALMLNLYGAADERNLADSDAICSALQMINFLQDVAIDRRRTASTCRWTTWRASACRRPSSTPPSRPPLARADAFEVKRARALMLDGAPLARRLPGRIGWELRLVVQGGLRILEAIEASNTMCSGAARCWAGATGSRSPWRAMRM